MALSSKDEVRSALEASRDWRDWWHISRDHAHGWALFVDELRTRNVFPTVEAFDDARGMMNDALERGFTDEERTVMAITAANVYRTGGTSQATEEMKRRRVKVLEAMRDRVSRARKALFPNAPAKRVVGRAATTAKATAAKDDTIESLRAEMAQLSERIRAMEEDYAGGEDDFSGVFVSRRGAMGWLEAFVTETYDPDMTWDAFKVWMKSSPAAARIDQKMLLEVGNLMEAFYNEHMCEGTGGTGDLD